MGSPGEMTNGILASAISGTSNALDRVNRERKRRHHVAFLFPNEASLLGLVSALLCEISQEWVTSRIYLDMSLTDPLRA